MALSEKELDGIKWQFKRPGIDIDRGLQIALKVLLADRAEREARIAELEETQQLLGLLLTEARAERDRLKEARCSIPETAKS